MAISRRDWLKTTSVGAAAALVPATGCDDGAAAPACSGPNDTLPEGLPTYSYSGTPGPETTFEHGVASGDPLEDRVILWTRVSPTTSGTVEVFYEVALDPDFTRRVAAAMVTTDGSKDYTVKVDPTGLRPGRTYYYRFSAFGRTSPIGRTRTLAEDGTNRLRFAMVSCSNYGFGYFHAYRNVAARSDLDAVLHLGDYIYEYGNDDIYPRPGQQLRQWEPATRPVTLDEFRTRYKLYKKDPDLQAVHRQHPFIITWDDHEIVNDTFETGAGDHDPLTEGDFAARKAAGTQALLEYQPVRATTADELVRNFRYGDLAEIIVLDTRHEGRDEQITNVSLDTPARHLISAEQEAWLTDTLQGSTAKWKIIAQQVMVAHFSINEVTHTPYFLDQWDGYPSARTRFFDIVEQHGGGNVVVLTGDIHGAFVAELPRDPWASSYDPATGAGALAVEIVCTSVTSPGFPSDDRLWEDQVIAACPHIKYADWSHYGYTILDVTNGKLQADFYTVDGIAAGQGAEVFADAYAVYDGRAQLVRMTGPTGDNRSGCEPAP